MAVNSSLRLYTITRLDLSAASVCVYVYMDYSILRIARYLAYTVSPYIIPNASTTLDEKGSHGVLSQTRGRLRELRRAVTSYHSVRGRVYLRHPLRVTR